MLFKKISGVQIVSLREQNRLAGTIIGSITGLFVGYYIAGYDFRGLDDYFALDLTAIYIPSNISGTMSSAIYWTILKMTVSSTSVTQQPEP